MIPGQRPAEKKIARVMRAIEQGSRTTRDVEAATGLPFRICAAHLSLLRANGLLTAARVISFGKPGRRSNLWEIAP